MNYIRYLKLIHLIDSNLLFCLYNIEGKQSVPRASNQFCKNIHGHQEKERYMWFVISKQLSRILNNVGIACQAIPFTWQIT